MSGAAQGPVATDRWTVHLVYESRATATEIRDELIRGGKYRSEISHVFSPDATLYYVVWVQLKSEVPS